MLVVCCVICADRLLSLKTAMQIETRETRVSGARVLKIDISGVPQMWIGVEKAARYYATESVAYTLGDDCVRLHGGVSRLTGTRSTLDIHPIIAVNGTSMADRLLRTAPRLTRFNRKLFCRGLQACARTAAMSFPIPAWSANTFCRSAGVGPING